MIVDRPESDKLVGLYRGVVVRHLQHGKLKVFVPAVYPKEYESEPDLLPDAEQITPSFAGSCRGNGVFSYPNVGAVVVCQFLNGDQNLPIVLGCTLGGENAYGQYETVKHIDEKESSKHLVTAGNTHIRLHEDGRINAVVTRPYDNDVSVDYDGVRAWLSANASVDISSSPQLSNEGFGVSRDVLDRIRAGELSNVNCQFSMTDLCAGVVSASAHAYDFGSDRYEEFLSAEQINHLSTMNAARRADSVALMDNGGVMKSDMLSDYSYVSSFNETKVKTEEVEQFAYKRAASAGSLFDRKVRGVSTLSGALHDELNTVHLKTQGQNVIVSDTVNTTADYQAVLDMQKTDTDLYTVGEDHVLSANKSSTYKMDQRREGRRDTQQGSCQDLAQWQFYENVNGDYEEKDDNTAEMTLKARKQSRYSVKLKQYQHIMTAGTIDIRVNGEYRHEADIKAGSMTIELTDRKSGGSCELTFDKSGSVLVRSTSSVTVRSPKITLDGQLEVTKPAVFDSTVNVQGVLTGQQLIKAGNDVQSRGISLVNHKHMCVHEMSPTTVPK